MTQQPRRRGRIRNFGRTTYHCDNPACGKDFGRDFRAWNAHHAAKHAGRWASAAARKAARSMGKDVDNARRHALGWLESARLREWKKVPVRDRKTGDIRRRKDGRPITREIPVETSRARTRPVLRGRVRARDLRAAQKHDEGHQRGDRADSHATRHGGLAAGHADRTASHAKQGRRLRAALSQARADAHQIRATIHADRSAAHRDRADARASR